MWVGIGKGGEDDAIEGEREGGRPASLPWLKPPAVASQDSTPVGMLARDDPMLKEANNLLWKWWVGLGRRSWWCDKEQGRPKIHIVSSPILPSHHRRPPSFLPTPMTTTTSHAS